MINNDEQLAQTMEQMERMYRALGALRNEVLPASPGRFALMAEGPLAEIRQLQDAIDAYTGRVEAEQLEAEVWLRIQGRDIAADDAPTSILTAFLDAFRKGVQSVAEFLDTGQLTTRPTARLKQACDFRVVALRPGSMRIGIRTFEEDLLTIAKEALDRRVEVTGTRCGTPGRRAHPTLRVARLTILDESDGELPAA